MTVKGRLVALALGLVFTVLVAEGVLRVAMPHWKEFHNGWFMQRVAVPGHGTVTAGKPGFDGYFAQNNGDFRVHIKINDFGLRNSEPVEAANGRIWIVGDSMAFGWGVEEDEMYSSVIGRQLNAPTYNVASPGTNVCGYQALLARMPKDFKPRAVVMGLILENDIHVYDCRKAAKKQELSPDKGLEKKMELKTFLNFKGFLTRYSALYNFFTVSLKRVAPVRRALTAIGIIREGHAYQRQITDDELEAAVEKTADEIGTFRSMLPEGTPFTVLISPGRFDLRDGDPFYRKLRHKMIGALQARAIAYVDPFDRFIAAGFDAVHFAHDGHWSKTGHKLAGEAVAEWLRDRLRTP